MIATLQIPDEASTAASQSFQVAKLGKDAFSLSDAVSFLQPEAESDLLAMFYAERVSSNEQKTLCEEDGIIQLWVARIVSRPSLAKVALIIYSTPASSCSSKRDFSIVKKILSSRRSRLKTDLVEDMVYIKSALSNE